MEENKNLEQAGATSAITEKKNESRKREASGKDVLAIRSFLESLSVYEADALRVSIAIADGKTLTARPPQKTFQRTTALHLTAISTAERTTSG